MIDQKSSNETATLGKLPSTPYFPWFDNTCKVIGLWTSRSRQRRHLAVLDDTALRDIGLTRREVQREIVKSFWQR